MRLVGIIISGAGASVCLLVVILFVTRCTNSNELHATELKYRRFLQEIWIRARIRICDDRLTTSQAVDLFLSDQMGEYQFDDKTLRSKVRLNMIPDAWCNAPAETWTVSIRYNFRGMKRLSAVSSFGQMWSGEQQAAPAWIDPAIPE